MDDIQAKELWKEIRFLLHENISPSISEEMYEQKIVQSLEKMGWSEFRKEIILKHSIQLGSVGRIVPDVIVKSSHNNQSFVIEVKKPSADIDNDSHKNQLVSYMRQLKLEYGLLIGSKIQIYYDGKFNKRENPILLKSITISESNANDLLFLKLFQKDTFSYENLENYAVGRIDELSIQRKTTELRKLLLSPQYQTKLMEIITDDLMPKWGERTINDVFNQIIFSISPKQLSIANPPDLSSHTHQPISDEIKIGQLVKSKLKDIIAYCELHDNEEISRLESKNYSKSTFNINFPFLLQVDYDSPKQHRYWKDKHKINGRYYVVTSEWFKGSTPPFNLYLDKISRQKG